MTTIINSKGQLIHIARMLFFLDPFDENGKPANINYDPNGIEGNTDLFKTLSSELLNDISSKLPESVRLQNAHPNWIKDSDLHINENNTTIDITFVNEGAGYKNGIAYYIYDTDSPPKSLDNIGALYIIFPNVSKTGSGGTLNAGDTVRLASEFTYDVVNNLQIVTPTNYTFRAGKSIGLVILANAWRSYKNSVNRDSFKYYSNSNFNPEKTSEKRKHMVCIQSDHLTDHIIIGFEDLHRDGNSDDDFNDAILLAKVVPYSSLNKKNINNTSQNRAIGTIICDDQIVEKNTVDNDYSDIITEYECKMNLSNNYITTIEMIFHLKHRSSVYDHEFGILIPNIDSINKTITKEIFVGNDSISTITNINTVNNKISVFDSTKTLLPSSSNSSHYANTHGDWYLDPTPVSSVKIKIQFNENIGENYFNKLSMPFTPYMHVYKSGEAGNGYYYEVVYNNLYNGLQKSGASNVSKIPKIIVLHDVLNYQCSLEKTSLYHAYPDFPLFLNSSMKKNINWYENKRDRYLTNYIETPIRNFTI